MVNFFDKCVFSEVERNRLSKKLVFIWHTLELLPNSVECVIGCLCFCADQSFTFCVCTALWFV